MSFLIGILIYLLITVTLAVMTRRKNVRTSSIALRFFKGVHFSMASTGTTANGTPLFALIATLQDTGANSNGVVSQASWTLSDTSIASIATQGASPSGVVYAEFDPIKVGTATITVTATVTDPDGTVKQFTATRDSRYHRWPERYAHRFNRDSLQLDNPGLTQRT